MAKRAVAKLIRITVKRPIRLFASSLRGQNGKSLASEGPAPIKPQARFRLLKINGLCLRQAGECLEAVEKNKVIDLLRYEPAARGRSLQEFLVEAQRFIDRGAEGYTSASDNRLIVSCWIVPGQSATSADESILGVPQGTPLLIGFYKRPGADAASMLRMCLAKWLAENGSLDQDLPLHIGIPATDETLERLAIRERWLGSDA
ncbi:conserved hypothetical protein [Burkholderia sp. 8Y]|nr:conserved hypothetical protein [Burkholderia sp. 8Y]